MSCCNKSDISDPNDISVPIVIPRDIKLKDNYIGVIFYNTYDGKSCSLHEGPRNDAIITSQELIKYGYKPFIFHDLNKRLFKSILKDYLSRNAESLVIYFTGHGTQVHDHDGDEKDGLDEAFVLMDGYVVDDDLKRIIDKNNNAKKLVLISDCCHSGTIFDIPSDSEILTISASRDEECATQAIMPNKKNCGSFTYYFWKYMNESRDSKIIVPKINAKLQKYKHSCVFNHECDNIL